MCRDAELILETKAGTCHDEIALFKEHSSSP